MAASAEQTLLELSRKLIDTIARRDWATYESMCAADLTCFEPEARGHLVEGLPFHKYYFDLQGSSSPRNVTFVSPHVRLMGDDAAVVNYVRLIQLIDANGSPQTVQFEETRVWQRINGTWKHVHFHRSANA